MHASQPERSEQANAPIVSSRLRIGTAGWSYKDWEGIFYPPGMRGRREHPLEYLARFFDTTEINTSFYGRSSPNGPSCGAAKAPP